MKNDKTKLIIWAVVALVVGVIIGTIITTATTGNATISLSKMKTNESEPIFLPKNGTLYDSQNNIIVEIKNNKVYVSEKHYSYYLDSKDQMIIYNKAETTSTTILNCFCRNSVGSCTLTNTLCGPATDNSCSNCVLTITPLTGETTITNLK